MEALHAFDKKLVKKYVGYILDTAKNLVVSSRKHFAQSKGHTYTEYYLLKKIKKVHFGSPLVCVLEYSIAEESFSHLDDTIPLYNEIMQVRGDGVKDQQTPDLLLTDEAMNNSSRSSLSQCVNDKEDERSIQVGPYNEFVESISKRIREVQQDRIESSLRSPEAKKLKYLSSQNDSYEEDTVMQSTPEFENDKTIPSHVSSIPTCTERHPNSTNSSMFLKLLQMNNFVDHEGKFHDSCSIESLAVVGMNDENLDKELVKNKGDKVFMCEKSERTFIHSQDVENADLVKPEYSETVRKIMKEKNGERTKSSMIAAALAQEILNEERETLLIQNETSKHDFNDKDTYRRYLFHDHQPSKHNYLRLCDHVHSMNDLGNTNVIPAEEIQSLLMPIGEEPKSPSYKTLPIIPLKPEPMQNIEIHGDTSRLEHLMCSPSSKVEVKESVDAHSSKYSDVKTQCRKYILFADTQEEDMAVYDEKRRLPSLQGEAEEIEFHKVPCEITKSEIEEKFYQSPQSKKPVVDDMISELMASQAVRSFHSSTSTTFDNFVRHVPAVKRQLIHERMEEATVVPDVDDLPGYERDESYLEMMHDVIKENVSFDDPMVKVDVNHLPEEKQKLITSSSPATSSPKKLSTPSFSRNPLKKNDDSVVPFSHEPFINIHGEFRTPQKVRLGLSKNIRMKKQLHPYRN